MYLVEICRKIDVLFRTHIFFCFVFLLKTKKKRFGRAFSEHYTVCSLNLIAPLHYF